MKRAVQLTTQWLAHVGMITRLMILSLRLSCVLSCLRVEHKCSSPRSEGGCKSCVQFPKCLDLSAFCPSSSPLRSCADLCIYQCSVLAVLISLARFPHLPGNTAPLLLRLTFHESGKKCLCDTESVVRLRHDLFCDPGNLRLPDLCGL